MKKLLIVIAGFMAIQNLHSQCTISANSNLAANQSTTFTVDTKAQCEECYSWKSSDEQIAKIEGNHKTSSITLSGKNSGKTNLSVSVFTEKGLVQCEKNLEVFGNIASKQNVLENSCGIAIDDFKDVKVNEGIISFFPNSNTGNYLYKWTVIYSTGESSESLEKIPQFKFSSANYINTVKLKLTNKALLCSITLVKKFDENYWKASRNMVEQKTYSPISYRDYVKSGDEKPTSN